MQEAKVSIIGALLALCFTGTLAADTTSFKIQDFIPQRFEDFQWRLDGYLNSQGSYSDQQYSTNPSLDYYQRNSNSDLSSGSAQGATDFVYQFRSVPHYLILSSSLSFATSGAETSTSSSYRPIEGGFDYDATKTEAEANSVGATQKLTADVGKYLYRDLFLSAMLNTTLNYTASINNSEEGGTSSNRFIDSIYYYSSTHTTSDYDYDSRNNRISLDIMPGWGRVYEGWYASTAMYIIEELRSHQLLVREPTKDEMLVLCDIVYQNRLKHAVDSRLRLIETLDEIFGYLKQSGLITETNHYAYLLIQDVWNYFPKTSRSFGTIVKVGVGGSYTFYSRHSTTDYEKVTHKEAFGPSYDYYSYMLLLYDTTYKVCQESYRYEKVASRDIYLTANVQYFKPISRRWQLVANLGITYYLDSYQNRNFHDRYWRADSDGESLSDRTRTYYTTYEDKYNGLVSVAGTYIVNSRTQLALGGLYEQRGYDMSTKSYGDRVTDPRETSLEFSRTSLSGSLSYRLSIPTTLSATWRHTWNNTDSEDEYYDYANKDYTHSYSLSIRISHYLY